VVPIVALASVRIHRYALESEVLRDADRYRLTVEVEQNVAEAIFELAQTLRCW